MVKNFKRTKIIATIGPATKQAAALRQLLMAGANVARLNFSHGAYSDHAKLIKTIRQVAKQAKCPVAIMQDLQGPRLRLGVLPAAGVVVKTGEKIVLATQKTTVVKNQIKILNIPAHLCSLVKAGQQILLDDGLVVLRAQKVSRNKIFCHVLTGGELKTHKGINLPGVKLPWSALTTKDLQDLEFGIKHNVDWVALSFVKEAKDIQQLRRQITKLSKKYLTKKLSLANWQEEVRIVAKIERPEAVKNLAEIIQAADAIMVARGDLGLELPPENVPLIQKDIIKRCNQAAKPVIVATQMLESMINNPLPTRAEMSDIENAILDGADAVMLSAETATGKYPIKAVRYMSQAARQIENYLSQQTDLWFHQQQPPVQSVTQAAGLAAVELADDVKAKLIVAATVSGNTARALARFRPRQPILAFTPSLKTYQQLNLSWGVQANPISFSSSLSQFIAAAKRQLLQQKIIKRGDRLVITAGYPFGKKGQTDLVKVEEV